VWYLNLGGIYSLVGKVMRKKASQTLEGLEQITVSDAR
jgi:hypothetical protein